MLKGNQRRQVSRDRASFREDIFKPITTADTLLYKIYTEQKLGQDERLLVLFIFSSIKNHDQASVC